MNELNITEYSSMSDHVGREPSLVTQSVEYDNEFGMSDPLNARTSFVRLISETDCRIGFSREGTVADPGSILPAGAPEYFRVEISARLIISVVQL